MSFFCKSWLMVAGLGGKREDVKARVLYRYTHHHQLTISSSPAIDARLRVISRSPISEGR